MKDLGKTIAKYRKEHKLNQSQLAKELENYDIYVKQNSISAWELGTATPNARQFLALCEILEIYDIYTEFVGQSPLNPFRNLNENGMNKVLEYISDLESTGNYKPADIILRRAGHHRNRCNAAFLRFAVQPAEVFGAAGCLCRAATGSFNAGFAACLSWRRGLLL